MLVLLFVLKHKSKVTYTAENTVIVKAVMETDSSIISSVEAMSMSVLSMYELPDVWRMQHTIKNLENLINIYQVTVLEIPVTRYI